MQDRTYLNKCVIPNREGKMVIQVISHYKILQKSGKIGTGRIYKTRNYIWERIDPITFLSLQSFKGKGNSSDFRWKLRSAFVIFPSHIPYIFKINKKNYYLFIFIQNFAENFLIFIVIAKIVEAGIANFECILQDPDFKNIRNEREYIEFINDK